MCRNPGRPALPLLSMLVRRGKSRNLAILPCTVHNSPTHPHLSVFDRVLFVFFCIDDELLIHTYGGMYMYRLITVLELYIFTLRYEIIIVSYSVS
jgi:hypothetical protein